MKFVLKFFFFLIGGNNLKCLPVSVMVMFGFVNGVAELHQSKGI